MNGLKEEKEELITKLTILETKLNNETYRIDNLEKLLFKKKKLGDFIDV